MRAALRRTLAIAAGGAALSLSSCGGDRAGEFDRVVDLTSPAPPGSAEPNLTVGPDGRVYLSWLEPVEGGGHALRFSAFDGTSWSPAKTVASGTGQLANWADFPSLAVLPGRRMVAHYLERDSAPSHGYGVRVVSSEDEGTTWSKPAAPHHDRASAEHGFVSLAPLSGDSVASIWLDGRATDPAYGGTGETALRWSVLASNGGWTEEQVIDSRVCDCCQTASARTSRGVIVAYRDRSAEEVRDISVVRLVQAQWSAPAAVHHDGWRIDGCPVNGPAVTAERERVAVAWFTAARDTARVLVSFSENAGESFAAPIRVDAGDPEGRVDVELLEDGRAVVSWVERVGARESRVLVRPVSATGEIGDTAMITDPSRSATGFPRMVRVRQEIFFAWTEAGEPSRVRIASARFEAE